MFHAVIDASVIVSWFFPDETSRKHDPVLNMIEKIKIHVPSIFEYEFINTLVNAEKRRQIDHPTVIKILEMVSQYPLTIESSTGLLKENIRIYEIAQANELTAYDAAYLELAIRLNLPLITYDRLLLNTAKKFRVVTSL